MPVIEPLSYSALDYLKSFGVVAVAVSPSGRVFVCRDPKGAAAAWWTKAEHADQIAHVAWANGDAAHRLGLSVTAHAKVIERVRERTARIEAALQQALDQGTLKMFNREFRKRRLAARAKGEPFMNYKTAQAKLRRVVTEMVSRGGLITQSLIVSVFDEARPR